MEKTDSQWISIFQSYWGSLKRIRIAKESIFLVETKFRRERPSRWNKLILSRFEFFDPMRFPEKEMKSENNKLFLVTIKFK